MRRRFAGFEVAGHLAVPAPATGAWLTGQSAAHHSRLSPGQLALLDDLTPLGFTAVRGGFPYNEAAMQHPYRAEPIGIASVRNTAQHVAATLSPRFAHDLAEHLQPLLDRTTQHLLLLCGSTGAQMMSAALPHVRLPGSLNVQVVALGPVGRLPAPRPRLRVHVIQGGRDLVSRWVYRGPVDTRVAGGHMDYAVHPDVRAEVLRVARELVT